MARALSLIGLLFTGCYLTQAAGGQLELIRKAKPIREVLPRVSEHKARLLWEVHRVKAFGAQRGLTATKNYERFVDLDRDAVVYVVSACQPLAFEPKRWSFPIAGSFTYLGWFDRADADKHAASLKTEGLDVYVRGASAYSTLGWFADPVLSTMLRDGDDAMGDLVNVILHESVHATTYVRGQSTFNESLAQFAGDRMTLEYLSKQFSEASSEYQTYVKSEASGEKRRALLFAAYKELDTLYKSDSQDKLTEKATILDRLQSDLRARNPINNATLIQFKTYRTAGDEFETLFSRCDKDWARFWAAIHALSPASFPTSQSDELGFVAKLDC